MVSSIRTETGTTSPSQSGPKSKDYAWVLYFSDAI